MPVFHCVQDNVHLNRPQSGCGVWHCASRTTVMGDCDGQTILTIEGLGTVDNPHPIQQAFIDQNPGATAAHSRMLAALQIYAQKLSAQAVAQWFDVTVYLLDAKDGVVFVIADASQQISYGQWLQGERLNLIMKSGQVPKDASKYTIPGTVFPGWTFPPRPPATSFIRIMFACPVCCTVGMYVLRRRVRNSSVSTKVRSSGCPEVRR